MRFKLFGGADCSDMFLAQLVPIVALSQSGDINELQEVGAKVVQLLLTSNDRSSSSSSSSESILADLQNTFIGSSSSSSSAADQQKLKKGGEQQQQQQKSSSSSSNNNNNNNNNNIELGLACCALHTIFTNIAIYNLDVQQSNKELIILGLSESAASVLSELAVSNRRDILASMANQVRMAPNIARIHVAMMQDNNNNNGEEEEEDDDDLPPGEERPVSYTVSLDRRLVSSSSSSSSNQTTTNSNVISFEADSESLKSLLAELLVAREAM